MANILVVEDDLKLNQIICRTLQKNSYQASGCKNPVEAYVLLATSMYDLIISDIMMPEEDGYTFAKTVREQDQAIPILFISSLDELTSKRKGYNLGIDDYIVKPVDLDDLILKIGALLRRANIANEKKLTIGSLVLIKDEMAAYVDGVEIPLIGREFQILYRLLSSPKKIFTRSELLDEYWGLESETGLRSVDVYITKLRNKFSACNDFEIITVHGFGYKAVVK